MPQNIQSFNETDIFTLPEEERGEYISSGLIDFILTEKYHNAITKVTRDETTGKIIVKESNTIERLNRLNDPRIFELYFSDFVNDKIMLLLKDKFNFKDI